jgi:hypothetical protein
MNPKRYHFSRLPERLISLLFSFFDAKDLSTCQPGSACTTKVQGQNVLCQVSYFRSNGD